MIRAYKVSIETQVKQPHKSEWDERTVEVHAHTAEDAVTQVSVLYECRVLMVWPAGGHFIERLEEEGDG